MAITTDSGYRAAAAAGDQIRWFKTAARTTVALGPFSLIDVAGEPGAGTLAGTSTAAGVVPTDATAGCPTIAAFSGSNTGYVDGIEIGNTVACRIDVYDMLFKAGAYAFNASQTLASQPSYSSRVPGGTDYRGTEIWVEQVTAATGSPSVAVTYTNESGTAARTTGTVATGAALTVGRMVRLPLQSGDSGVSKIESVTATVASAGTFNILVLRRLGGGRIRVANDTVNYGPDLVRLPQVFADSALFFVVTADSTSSGACEATVKIING